MNKKSLIFLTIAILIFGALFSLFSPAIFQEGNPWPEIKGIVQLNFGESDMVRLSGTDDQYMTKSKNGQEAIKNFMKVNGFEFTEQMGSGFLFVSPAGKRAVAVHRYYSRYYSIWKITENDDIQSDDIIQPTISDELKECLPKSDMGSRDKCEKLLASINNFDGCVSAGFSIMKSNPPQCATPDGRTFVQTARPTNTVKLVEEWTTATDTPIALAGFSFTLPPGWHGSVYEKPYAGGKHVLVQKDPKRAGFVIDCPPDGKGLEEATRLSTEERSFVDDGVTYTVSFEKWISGGNEPWFFVWIRKTIVESSPAIVCLIQGGTGPDIEKAMRTLYNTWGKQI